ncbi:MAG TPA: hypothetical protein VNO50_00975 [Pyrinomonadaceae bacterium]|nr:hypothetical protein [Pyrinomonadaceae bacterium]
MSRNLKLISIAVGLCMLMALSVSVSAQNRRYNRVNTKAEIDRLIRRVENQSDRFVRSFDRSLDNSRLDGTMREDNLNQRASALETDLDYLRQQFDRTDRYLDTRSQVSRVMSTAEGINGVVRRRRLGGNTERAWAQLRSELNALASAYNVRQLR